MWTASTLTGYVANLSASYDKLLLAINAKIANGEISPVRPFSFDNKNAGSIYIKDECAYMQKVLASAVTQTSDI